jgi:diguanylate cyclase (GGDEF)-like protein
VDHEGQPAGRRSCSSAAAAAAASGAKCRFRRADGRELWAEVATCPITGADGCNPPARWRWSPTPPSAAAATTSCAPPTPSLRSMVADLERHKQDMAQIAELNELLQSARTEAEALRRDPRRGRSGCSPAAPAGLSIAGSGDEMVRVGSLGSASRLGAGCATSREACWAIRRGGPHLQAPAHGVRCRHCPDGEFGNRLCMPLYVEGQLLGVLHVAGETGEGVAGNDPLDQALQQRVEIFGEVIKLGLSNLRLRDTLRDQALRDALTGLPNRRLFDETLPRELARCVRSGQALTVAIVDVDRFKLFNDRYGHDVGDRVLRSVAETLQRSIRSGDLACRYGGDEFLCLLVGTTAAEALARFTQLLAQHRVDDELDDGTLPERVTFTIGLACAPDVGTEAAALLRAADAALYAAKARGGNGIEVAPRLDGGDDAASSGSPRRLGLVDTAG